MFQEYKFAFDRLAREGPGGIGALVYEREDIHEYMHVSIYTSVYLQICLYLKVRKRGSRFGPANEDKSRTA